MNWIRLVPPKLTKEELKACYVGIAYFAVTIIAVTIPCYLIGGIAIGFTAALIEHLSPAITRAASSNILFTHRQFVWMTISLVIGFLSAMAASRFGFSRTFRRLVADNPNHSNPLETPEMAVQKSWVKACLATLIAACLFGIGFQGVHLIVWLLCELAKGLLLHRL